MRAAACGGLSWLSVCFQAEDGIRDVAVTGVQACALPIYRPSPGDQKDLDLALGLCHPADLHHCAVCAAYRMANSAILAEHCGEVTGNWGERLTRRIARWLRRNSARL